jgi:coenzyme PQQ synthesis protein D (PqqD)
VTTSRISESASVVASRDLLATKFGAELVILSLRDGVYYSLEDVGVRIWQLIQEPVTLATIRDALVSEYDVASAPCERDIRMLCRELERHGLLEVRENP